MMQIKMLNTSKGPAVHSLRAQADRKKYQARMKHTLEKQENLEAFLTEYGSHTAIMADEMNFSQNWQDVVYEINLFLGE